MTARAPLFLVPRRNVLTLCRVEGDDLVELLPTTLPLGGQHDVSESGWIAWAHEDGPQAHLLHADAGPDDPAFPPLSLPPRWEVNRLRFAGDRLLVLALADTEHLGDFDLRASGPLWPEQPWRALPKDYEVSGDLCLLGQQLVVLSRDGIRPGFGTLDLTDDLRIVDRREVPREWNSEAGEFAAVGDNWFVQVSFGWGLGGEGRHFHLFDRERLELRGTFHLVQRESFLVYGSTRHDPEPRHVAWLGDRLLLAVGQHGVAVLDLRGRGASAWSQANLTYHPTDGVAVRVLPTGDGRRVLVVLRDGEKQDTRLLDLGP
jgi:hypothetical protein